MSVEDYAVAPCPICGRNIVVPRVYAPAGYGVLKYIAVDHNTHAVIIGFDKFGVIRTTKAYRYAPACGNASINCPRCGKAIYVPSSTKEPLAANHGDHIAVVFPLGSSFEVKVYDKVNQIKGVPKPSIIKKIVREMGYDGLAYSLYQVYVQKSKTIMAPAIVADDLKKLIKDVLGVTVLITPGMPLRINSPEIEYFVRVIKKVENFTYPEAVHMLRDAVEVLDGLKESLQTIMKLQGYQAFCRELKRVAEGDPLAYKILEKMFPIKCP